MDAAASGSSLFTLAREASGPDHAPHFEAGHLFELDSVVLDGQLQVSLTYREDLHTEATVQALAHAFLDSLRALISGHTTSDALRYTPLDFPLARLSQAELDGILPLATPIEDVYPLSPMQQGMLFHALLTPSAGLYFNQISWAFHTRIDLAIFRRAWDAVIARHPILRTSFRWEKLAEPLQVVHLRASLPFEELDWRGLTPEEQARRFDSLLAEDHARGVDLRTPPLMRLTAVRMADDVLRFVWGTHHLLLDGWSLGLLFKEIFTFYEELLVGGSPRLARAPAFRDYIAWIQQQPLDRAEAYWRQTLRGFTAPTPLPAARASNAEPGRKERLTHQLAPAETAALQSFVRRHQLTLNTLVQGAWAILQSRYSGEPDVLFGLVVAGRPPELPGIEQAVGLFINSLPARIRLSGEDTVLPWLQRLQAEHLERSQYEHIPLVRVQGWSDVPRSPHTSALETRCLPSTPLCAISRLVSSSPSMRPR